MGEKARSASILGDFFELTTPPAHPTPACCSQLSLLTINATAAYSSDISPRNHIKPSSPLFCPSYRFSFTLHHAPPRHQQQHSPPVHYPTLASATACCGHTLLLTLFNILSVFISGFERGPVAGREREARGITKPATKGKAGV